MDVIDMGLRGGAGASKAASVHACLCNLVVRRNAWLN